MKVSYVVWYDNSRPFVDTRSRKFFYEDGKGAVAWAQKNAHHNTEVERVESTIIWSSADK